MEAAPRPCPVKWLTSSDQLDRWLIGVTEREGATLALDTEFERVDTFYPVPGLVQLGSGTDFFLVDPAVAESSQAFKRVLEDPDVTKLLYAMSEDLELFRHWLKVDIRGCVDLQIGVALAGEGFSVGYARIVEQVFGEELDKSATRSDWIKRPLSREQENYAIDDVRFLEPLASWVFERLRGSHLESALIEESDRFAEDLAGQEDHASHYLKLRGGWRLSARQQGVLQKLAEWREAEARRVNRPRNRVVSDQNLIALAEACPLTLRDLGRIDGIPAGLVRRRGEVLIELVKSGMDRTEEVVEPIPRPLTREQQGEYKRLKKLMVRVAEGAGVPIETFAPRRRLEAVLSARTLAGSVFESGWRRQLLEPVQPELEEILAS